MAEFWVFWIVAPLALGAALAMVLMRSAVHAALMLVLSFFMVAVLFAVLEAQFLAVVQIIVYAGAVMVLFLFVLMLLGVAYDEPFGQPVRGLKPAALALGAVLLIGLAAGVGGPYMTAASVCDGDADPAPMQEETAGRRCAGLAEANADGNTRGVGMLLFTRYTWPFETTSLLLMIAAIGAVVLGKRRDEPADLVDRIAEPAVEPEEPA